MPKMTKTFLDYHDTAFRSNPFEVYRQLRQDQPVVRGRVPLAGEVWLVTRYDDVVALCRDGRLRHDVRTAPETADRIQKIQRWLPRAARLVIAESLLVLDNPDHGRLRKLSGKAFSAHRVRQIEDMIQQACQDLAVELRRPTKPFDLMQRFAVPLPMRVIADMLGVSKGHRDRFRRLAAGFIELGTSPKWAIPMNLLRGELLLRDVTALVRRRRSHPQDDFLTDLVQAVSEGERMSESELQAMILLLLLTGHETTSNLIGLSTLTLLSWPDQWAALSQFEALPDEAVEELLRFSSPVEHGVPRYANEDLEIAGQVIRKGEIVIPVFASANHDETVFEQPDQLNFERKPNRHVAFGLGGHLCLGAPLARMEAKHAMPHILRTFSSPSLAIDATSLAFRPSSVARGLRSLPMAPVRH